MGFEQARVSGERCRAPVSANAMVKPTCAVSDRLCRRASVGVEARACTQPPLESLSGSVCVASFFVLFHRFQHVRLAMINDEAAVEGLRDRGLQLHFSQIPGHTARSHYMGGGGVHMDTTAHRCAEAALSRQRRSSGSCCSYTRSTEDSCSNAGMRATLRRLKQWDADAAEQGDTPHREW